MIFILLSVLFPIIVMLDSRWRWKGVIASFGGIPQETQKDLLWATPKKVSAEPLKDFIRGVPLVNPFSEQEIDELKNRIVRILKTPADTGGPDPYEVVKGELRKRIPTHGYKL